MNLKLHILNDTKLAMPGGGLYSLVAYGAQNVLLSGNPAFTYFYKTYKKYHSHYSATEADTHTRTDNYSYQYNKPYTYRNRERTI